MPTLNTAERRTLRARAHPLNPVASVSRNGLTPAVLAEIDRALDAHELLKLRVYGEERAARERILGEICAALDCAPVQHIGHILVVFRRRKEAPPAAAAKPAVRRGRPAARPAPKAPRPASPQRRRSA